MDHVVRVQGGSESAASVTGGRLDVNFFEGGFLEDPAIGHAIERDATRHTEFFEPRLGVDVSCHF